MNDTIQFHWGWLNVEPNGEQCKLCEDAIYLTQYQVCMWTPATANNPDPIEDMSLCGPCYTEHKEHFDKMIGE